MAVYNCFDLSDKITLKNTTDLFMCHAIAEDHTKSSGGLHFAPGPPV